MRSRLHGPERRPGVATLLRWHDPCEPRPQTPMLEDFALYVPASIRESERKLVWETLSTAFPGLPGRISVIAEGARAATELLWVRLGTSQWRAHSFDPVSVDRQIHAAVDAGWLRVALVMDEPIGVSGLVETASEVLTRYQRFVDRRNGDSTGAVFEGVLQAHRDLYDLRKPLVRADYEHAIDAWRWLLRLDAGASQAVQLATLFHDVERLVSEADVRIEQHAPDYVAFKRVHASRGAALARDVLRPLGLAADVVARAVDLIERHEHPSDDPDLGPDLRLINDADGLSYFSLNACGFLDHYGPEHTEKKIDYTLGRLSPWALPLLREIRLRADFCDLLRRRLVKACLELAAEPPVAAPGLIGKAAARMVH